MPKPKIERRRLVTLVASVALAVGIQPSLADDAIDPAAKDAVTRMGRTLSTGVFYFQTDTIRQFEKDNLPLHVFHSAQVLVRRPDRLMVHITGDDGQTQIAYDGTTLTLFGVTVNKYSQ